jgi:mannonate dehydratase
MQGLHQKLPPDIKLGCDVHSKLDQYPTDALQFAIDLQSLPIFYLEDLIAPENEEFYRVIRAKTSTPLAMGEMYTNPEEWRPLVENRTVDYIRNHVSHMGGFTAARKLAALCEQFQVRFAWHGSEDISPVGHMAGLTLDVVSPGFGIHEWQEYPDVTKSMFTGYKQLRDGMAWVSDKPGWGIEFDEKEAAKHPIGTGGGNGGFTRLPDGGVGP